MVHDVIGEWSEAKLSIIQKYAEAYAKIVGSPRYRLQSVYIDGFAGSGQDVSRTTGRLVSGSPLIALGVQPRFTEYHFIDLEGDKVDSLRKLAGADPSIHVYRGDCSDILLGEILPTVRYAERRRALCVLDPYGLHLRWEVVARAAELGTVELFINFPLMDMNRNVLWRRADLVSAERRAPMTAWWGDESWQSVVYPLQQGQLWDEPTPVKGEPQAVVKAYRTRLQEVAGFRHVPPPVPMRNSRNNTVYWLFFASQNATGAKIAGDILRRYRPSGGQLSG